MKQKLTLLILALFTTMGAWAVDVKISTFNQPVTKNGAWVSNYEFKTNAFSGLADVTITAPNTDFNIGYKTDGDAATKGDGYVNDGYGYCLRLVTSDTNSHTVQLNAPSGYKIVGYSFLARSNSGSNNHVLTPAGGTAITSTTSGVWVTVKEILESKATFTIQTQNGGNTLYIPQFTISLVADTKKVVDTKVTAGAAVSFGDIDNIADGTTPVVLYCSGRGTYQFDNPYDNILGGFKSSTGVMTTSSVKFIVEKSGDNYKIINLNTRKYIPAYTADNNEYTTMLPSNVSGAPTFTIVDNDGSTYGIKYGTHSFNGKGEGYGYFTYWGNGASGNSGYKIMEIASEEALEYTIPDKFFAPTAYYRIKVAGRGDYYLSAGSSDTYIHLSTDAFNHTGAQVWKTYLASQGVKLYSMGANKYVAFNPNKNAVGSSISAFTTSEQAAYNFIPEDKGDGNYGFKTLAPLGSTYLSNNGGTGNGSMGYYTSYDAGGQLQFERVYRVILRSDMGGELGYIYSDGAITSSDLDDYDYFISGVAKTKEEVVEAVNAVTADDELVLVCARQRSATISSKAEIDQTKVYAITVKRGKLMYAAKSSGIYKAYFSTTLSQTYNDNALWAFVTVDDGDNYYLYNVGQKCFLMSKLGDNNFMDSKFTAHPITLATGSDASYPIRLKDGSNFFNENSGNVIINSWSYVDGGNEYSIQAIGDIDFDPSEAQAMLNAMSGNVPFITSPAPSEGSFDAATTWYFLSMRPGDGNGGYYAKVPDDYNYAEPTNIPLETTTGNKAEEDKYRWCITGSMADGYRLYNKAAGADRVFVFDGGGKMKSYSGNENASLFYLAKAGSPSGVAAPTFVFASTDSRPNRQSNSIATWSNNDTGSEFGFVFDVDYDGNNFYTEYAEIVKPFMDDELSSNYFHLTSAKQKENIWNVPDRYSDGVEHSFYSHDDVTEMRDAVEAYLKKPIGSVAVRMKNNNTGKYVSYGSPTYGEAGLICDETFPTAEADLTSVLQIIPADASNYYIYMPTLGKYVGSQTTGNRAFPLVEEASRAQFKLTPTNTPGVISINNTASAVDANFQGYLHGAGWAKPGVVNWQASNASSLWNIEDASTICFDMISPAGVTAGEDVYMTYVNRLGLPLNAPADASVWTISSQNAEKAYMSEVDSKDVPADGAVILKAEKGSTVHMNIKTSTTETLAGNILVAGDGSTTVAEGNYMLAYNSTDEIAKFYAIGASGFVVPANKAYLPAMGSSVKALVLSFDDDATGINSIENGQLTIDNEIYNLAGQRISKMQKGINIVNGKKILK